MAVEPTWTVWASQGLHGVERVDPGAGVMGPGLQSCTEPSAVTSVFMSPLLVSADCDAVATEDGVCGRFLCILRYLNRHHQRSFSEEKRVLSSHILKLFGDFSQEIEVFLMSHIRECHVGVTVVCRTSVAVMWENVLRMTAGHGGHDQPAAMCLFAL